jgi:hypothetical protein
MLVGRAGSGGFEELRDVLLGALRVQPGRWYLRVDLERYVELIGVNGKEYRSPVSQHVSTVMGDVFRREAFRTEIAGDGGTYQRQGHGTKLTAYRYVGPPDYPDPATNLLPLRWGHLVGMRPQHWGDEFVARYPGRCLWPGCGAEFRVSWDVLRVIQFQFPAAPTLPVHTQHAPDDVEIRRKGDLLPTEKGPVTWR